MRYYVYVLTLMVLLVAACQPVQAEAPQPEIQLPTEAVVVDGVGPSAASDPAKAQAEDEFLAVALSKEQAYYGGDVEGHLSYYADDIVSIWPESPPVVGKTALAEGMRPFMEENTVAGTLTVNRIWVAGDYATRQAEWEEVLTPMDGSDPVHYIGRCTLTWQKIDGEWKVVSEFVNFLEPPTSIR